MKKIKEILGLIFAFSLITGLLPIGFMILTEKFPILLVLEFGFIIAWLMHELLK